MKEGQVMDGEVVESEVVCAQGGDVRRGKAAPMDRERLCNDLMNTSVIAALIGGSHEHRKCVVLLARCKLLRAPFS